MKLYLSVFDGHRERDLAVELQEGATVADVAGSLPWIIDADRPERPQATLAHTAGGALETALPATRSGLRSGQRVKVVAATAPTDNAAAQLVWRNAPGGARTLALRTGDNTVGRESFVRIDEPSMSRKHLSIVVDGAKSRVMDLGSSNGTEVDGEKLPGGRARTIANGALIKAGIAELQFRSAAKSPGASAANAITYFNRPPRTEPRYGGRDFKAPKPPEPIEPEPFGWAMATIPLVMAGVMYVVTKSAAVIAFSAVSPLMVIAQWWQSRANAREKYARLVAQFRSDLEILEREVESEQRTEIAARRLQAPPSTELLGAAVNCSPSLWLRGLDDDDFLHVRVGQGDQPSRVSIEIPEGGERIHRASIEALPTRFGIVADVPVEADLRAGGLGIAGTPVQRDSAVRSILGQVTSLHSPAEVSVAALLGETDAPSWEWLKWLPHTRYPLSRLDGEHLAATPAGCADLLRRLRTVKGSGDGSGSETVAADSWIIVLIDEKAHLDRPLLDSLLRSGPQNAITFLWLAERPEDLPRSCQSVCVVDESRPVLSFSVTGSGVVQPGIRADLVTYPDVEAFARGLAPVQDVSARTAAELDLPTVVLLSELLGGEDVLLRPEVITQRWQAAREKQKSLEAPVGLAPGAEYAIDIVRQGPHGFLIGTTGSGKSELLRTLLVSIAATFPPERINFLLIDFKGGAALRPFLELPHTIGLVTNLRESEADGDEKLEAKVKRTIVWLRAELQRRMEILNDHGVSDIADMEKRHNPATPPRLLIVADEFAVLANRSSNVGDDVIDEIVNIARLGRSLGIHLLLATQRAGGVISDNIRANTNLRIALRVQDVAESKDVVGAPDAALISLATPGRAFVSVGASSLVQLQTASSTGHTAALRTVPRATSEDFTFIGRAPQVAAPPTLPSGTGPNDLDLLTAMVRRAATTWPTKQPSSFWVEPPAEVVPLTSLTEALGPLSVTLGLLDDPMSQTVRPAVLDLASIGNVLVYGTGGAGKTVVLRTAIASFARRFDADRFRFVGIDGGGRGLAPLAAFAQCIAIATVEEIEVIYRIFRELRETIDRRSKRFAEHGVADLSEERERVPGGTDQHAVVVLVDGLNTVVESLDHVDNGLLVDRLGGLVLDGRPAGVHFLLSASRRGGIPMGIISAVQQTIVLRMSSNDELGMVDVKPSQFPIGAPPGRGVLGRHEFQAAMVTSDAHAEQLRVALDAHDEAEAAELVEQARTGDAQIRSLAALAADSAHRGTERAPRIEALPEEVRPAQLGVARRPWMFCVGLGERSALGVAGTLAEAHLIVAGPPRSGKSNALAMIARSLSQSTPGLRTILLCSRSSDASESGLFGEVARNELDAIAVLERLTGTAATADPTLLCVDDFPDFDDAAFGYPFTQLMNEVRRGTNVRVVLAGEARALMSNFNDGARAVRRYRTGLLLQPDPDTDGDLVGSRLPRQLWRKFAVGRGYLVSGSNVEIIQVARAGSTPE